MQLRELLTTETGRPYWLYPWIPRGGQTIIGAPSKSMKSFLALNLAYSLASGESFLGWPHDGPRKVLYIEREIGIYGMKERLQKLHVCRNSEHAMTNLMFAIKGNEDYLLDSDAAVLRMQGLVKETRPDVLFLDPLRRFHFDTEDSSDTMSKVFSRIDAVQKVIPGLGVVIIHHTGKRSEFRDPNSPEALRGSSFIFDAGDVYAMVEKRKGKGMLRLHTVFRHTAEMEPINIKFDPNTYSFQTVETE